MWTECVLTAAYLINRTPTSVLNGKSPYEMIYKCEPNLSLLKVFGCLCFSTVLNNSDKFSSRSEKCVFIGYSFDKKGFKLFSLETKKVLYSRDVKFYETVFPFKHSSEKENYEFHFQNTNGQNFFNSGLGSSHDPYDDKREKESVKEPKEQVPDKSEGIYQPSAGDSSDDILKGEVVHPDVTVDVNNEGEENATLEENEKQSEGDDDYYQEFNDMFHDVVVTPVVTPEREANMRTYTRKSSRKTNQPIRFNDYVLNSKVKYSINKSVNYSNLNRENYVFSTNLNKIVEPKTYSEAAKNPKWIDAMDSEVEALHRNNTYEIVELPAGRRAIGCKWVWKIKYNSDGSVERYKARLVAKGYNQKEGIDYEETFSPVVKIVTVRIIISIAVQNSWPLYQLDINNAFLYGELDEDVYMQLPEGYFDKNDKRVCKLNKSLYGLKQAPRKWNEKLTSVLKENGFNQSKSDFSLFTKSENDVFLVLLVYVDDIVITGNNVTEIEKTANHRD